MNNRSDILEWAGQGAVRDIRGAWRLGGVLPTTQEWRQFLDRLLLWSGALALAAAAVFFIAYNWTDLGKVLRFAMVEILVLVAVLGYWRLGVDKASGKASLLVASILLGVLLALFGQTYQTGADTWQLFATWAALMAPWVLIGRFTGLWMLWFTVANVAVILYFQVFSGVFGVLFDAWRQMWVLFCMNTAALLVWEAAARRVVWMQARWAARLLAMASGVTITMLVFQSIFSWHTQSLVPLLVYGVWLVAVYLAYRVRMRDLFILSGACLSVIVLVTALLTRTLMEGRVEEMGLLMTAAIVIAMSAAFGAWLKRVAREEVA